MAHITYALLNNKLMHVDNVKNGLKCGCVCKACGEKLIARNMGKIQIHHFAHASGTDCAYGYETSLHLLAKETLSKHKSIFLPINVFGNNSTFLVSKAGFFQYKEVFLEKKISDIIPDVLLRDIHGNEIIVEIKVTHAIDEVKRKKIQRLEISTIEIDLSMLLKEKTEISEKLLKNILINDSPYKNWIFNKEANNLKKVFYYYSEKKPISIKNISNVYIVYNCPLSLREYHGRPYAQLKEDCYKCEYFLGEVFPNIYCFEKINIHSISELRDIMEVKREGDFITEVVKKGEVLKYNKNS